MEGVGGKQKKKIIKKKIKNRSTSYFHRLLLIFLSHLRILVGFSFLLGKRKKKKNKQRKRRWGEKKAKIRKPPPEPQTTRTHTPASPRPGAQSGRGHCTISSRLVRSTAHFPPGFAERYRLTRAGTGPGGGPLPASSSGSARSSLSRSGPCFGGGGGGGREQNK